MSQLRLAVRHPQSGEDETAQNDFIDNMLACGIQASPTWNSPCWMPQRGPLSCSPKRKAHRV